MLQRPILSGRLGKWAYALIEYDLKYEALRAMKGQVVADFIVDPNVNDNVYMAEKGSWKMVFDGSVCDHGQGVSCFVVSPGRLNMRCRLVWCLNALTIKLSMRHY
jgi:hypothetical protein